MSPTTKKIKRWTFSSFRPSAPPCVRSSALSVLGNSRATIIPSPIPSPFPTTSARAPSITRPNLLHESAPIRLWGRRPLASSSSAVRTSSAPRQLRPRASSVRAPSSRAQSSSANVYVVVACLLTDIKADLRGMFVHGRTGLAPDVGLCVWISWALVGRLVVVGAQMPIQQRIRGASPWMSLAGSRSECHGVGAWREDVFAHDELMRYGFQLLYLSNLTLLHSVWCSRCVGGLVVQEGELGAESIHLRWKQLGCCDSEIGGHHHWQSGELMDLWWKCCCSRQLKCYSSCVLLCSHSGAQQNSEALNSSFVGLRKVNVSINTCRHAVALLLIFWAPSMPQGVDSIDAYGWGELLLSIFYMTN